ncbi:hypothetical protein [Marinicella sp. W31]|uniref:hypothetical protein n=1 Tax=Marinicella sp. W31 TaxID=3023713 RepID=UPI003757AD5B
MKSIFVRFIILTAIISCNSDIVLASDQNKVFATLVGIMKNSQNTVRVRTIDKGEILFDQDYNLPTEAKVKPGEHEVSVMCEFFYESGSKLVPGIFQIEARKNITYQLVGKLSDDGMSCEVIYDEVSTH